MFDINRICPMYQNSLMIIKKKTGTSHNAHRKVHIISILVYKRKPESLSSFPNQRENKIKK